MAPLFYFLFTGIFWGLMTAWVRHEDGFGAFSDVELGLLGSIIGGMTYVLWSHNASFTLVTFLLPPTTAMLAILVVGRVTGNQRRLPR